MNENERPYCSHPELWPASWDEPKPLPVQMVGPCKHNLICPVCGFGWGCWPDPCDPKATGFVLTRSVTGYPNLHYALASAEEGK